MSFQGTDLRRLKHQPAIYYLVSGAEVLLTCTGRQNASSRLDLVFSVRRDREPFTGTSHGHQKSGVDEILIINQVSSEPNTVWLCGDSTMAPGGGHNGTEGWGQYLQYSLDRSRIVVNNSAYAGRSARTFTREGRFQAIFDKVRPGDWAVIEFGHNDGRKR